MLTWRWTDSYCRCSKWPLLADVRPDRLIVEREKLAQHLVVSAGVCSGGKSRLLFVEEETKVNADYYVGRLLPELIADCVSSCPQTSSSSKTASQLTRHESRRIGCKRTVLGSLKRI